MRPHTSITTLRALAGAAAVSFAFTVTSTLAATYRVPTDFPTIQQAINASVNGDTVLIEDGTYTGLLNRNLDFGGRLITVGGESEDPALCIIDCQNAARAFWFHSNESNAAVVRDLTITRGLASGTAGGGMLCDGSSPTIANCIFDRNRVTSGVAQTTGGGGGLMLDGSDALVEDCVFTGNSATAGGHITGFGGALCIRDSSDVTVTGCIFDTNAVSSGTGGFRSFGGAVCVATFSNAEFTDCMFTENACYVTGGAMYVGSSADATLTYCVFDDNRCDGSGGALVVDGSSGGLGVVVQLDWCTFVDNDGEGTEPSQAGIGGGAIANVSGTLVANYCRFLDNSSTVGGGISTTLSGDTKIENGLFAGNTANDAAAVNSAFNSDTELDCSTVTANTATTTSGSVSSYGSGSTLYVKNCIVYDNTAPSNVQVSMLAGGSLSVIYSDIEGGWSGSGNVDVDPLFVDPAGGDYRLMADSPVIDAGHNAGAPAVDLDNKPRIVDGDGDTVLTVDMGAYEFQTSTCPADTNGDGLVDVNDLNNVVLDWGTDGSANGGDLVGQLPGSPPDGVVDVNDLNAVIVGWGVCP